MPQSQEVVIVGKDGTEHVFPPGFDPKRAAAIVGGSPETTLGKATGITGPMPMSQRVRNALPNALGMVGSLAGGKSNPLGMLLSSVGGSLGEASRQALAAWEGQWGQVPPDLQSQITGVITEGAKQGGLEAGGRLVVGPVLKLLGHAAYRGVLKPPVAVRREFGGKEVTDTLIQEGIPITRSGAGTAKVEAKLGEAGQETRQTLGAAEAAGAKPVMMRPVVASMARTREGVADRVIRKPALQEIASTRNAALKENPQPIPLTRAQDMKQAEQGLALEAYKAEARGAPVNSLQTSLHEDLARGLREAIERRVPGIRAKNQRTQRLIGALKAITAAEGRIANNNLIGMGDILSLATGGAGYAVGGPQMAAVGILQEVLTRPEIASRLGIVTDRAGKPMIAPQMLRTVREALNQLQASSESP